MLGRVGGIDGFLQVVRWRGCTQAYVGYILFRLVLKLLDALGGLSRAEYHYTCGQRVECTGVAHLEFLYPYLFT